MLEFGLDLTSAADAIRSLDTALEDDDAAIRVLSYNIDGNGTGNVLLYYEITPGSFHDCKLDTRR
jgi:hypothetical protein